MWQRIGPWFDWCTTVVKFLTVVLAFQDTVLSTKAGIPRDEGQAPKVSGPVPHVSSPAVPRTEVSRSASALSAATTGGDSRAKIVPEAGGSGKKGLTTIGPTDGVLFSLEPGMRLYNGRAEIDGKRTSFADLSASIKVDAQTVEVFPNDGVWAPTLHVVKVFGDFTQGTNEWEELGAQHFATVWRVTPQDPAADQLVEVGYQANEPLFLLEPENGVPGLLRTARVGTSWSDSYLAVEFDRPVAELSGVMLVMPGGHAVVLGERKPGTICFKFLDKWLRRDSELDANGHGIARLVPTAGRATTISIPEGAQAETTLSVESNGTDLIVRLGDRVLTYFPLSKARSDTVVDRVTVRTFRESVAVRSITILGNGFRAYRSEL